MDEGKADPKKVTRPPASDDLPATQLPSQREVRPDQGDRRIRTAEDLLPTNPEVRRPRDGPPVMPSMHNVEAPLDVQKKGAPQMPSMHNVEAPTNVVRKGPPQMPSMTNPKVGEVNAPRQGPPTMPSLSNPKFSEIYKPREGPPQMPAMSNPKVGEVHAPRQGPPQMPSMANPKMGEVHKPREGPPQMPSMANPKMGEVHKPREGPPQMPSMKNPKVGEVHAPRTGPPSMPAIPNPEMGEVHAPRTGPPTMPTMANPKMGEIHAQRQGPPTMPTMTNPAMGEVHKPREGPPRMPTMQNPLPGDVRADRAVGNHRPLAPASTNYEIKKDHPVRTELPPLHVDPGQVHVDQEGMKARKVRVMTTGVFDLLHLGHVHMLEAARKLGDELYVVVARDETVRKMKHEPLNGEEIRRQIVEQLKPVTKAVVGHVGDIYRTVQDVHPDVIALGFDQKFTEEEVRRRSAEHGVSVRVVRLPQFDHDLDATRKIIERIGDRIAKKELYTAREE